MFYNDEYENKKIGAVEIIIILNIILFIPWLIYYLTRIPHLFYYVSNFLNLNVNHPNFLSVNQGAYWQVITAMFLHGGIGHIFFNMYGLYFFGKPLELRWGRNKFLLYYLGVGICANISSALFFYYTGQQLSLIGASGAIFGVLLAFAGYYPNTKILLFLFIPMKVKWAILLFAILELFFEISNTASGIAHITHLFGFLFGFFILILFFNMNPIKEMFFSDKDKYIIY